MSLLKSFFHWNIDTSFKLTPHSLWEGRGFAIYEWVAKGLLGEPGVKSVIDVGAGRTWWLGDEDKQARGLYLIGIDIDAEELALNPSLDERHAMDICDGLGVEDNSVDLILCRATVEHLHDTEAFLRNAERALKPGGKLAMVFAGKWAPPMLMNRMLPEKVSAWLLQRFVPNSKGYQGFKAYYDKCSHSEFKAALKRVGLNVTYDYASYYSSAYFQFFLPIHFLSILLDLLRSALSIRELATMYLFVVEKPKA